MSSEPKFTFLCWRSLITRAHEISSYRLITISSHTHTEEEVSFAPAALLSDKSLRKTSPEVSRFIVMQCSEMLNDVLWGFYRWFLFHNVKCLFYWTFAILEQRFGIKEEHGGDIQHQCCHVKKINFQNINNSNIHEFRKPTVFSALWRCIFHSTAMGYLVGPIKEQCNVFIGHWHV